MQEFINHWTAVNATLGDTPLILRGGYTVANLTTDRIAILNAINVIISADIAAQTASGNLSALRLAIRPRIIQFRKWVSGYLPGTGYANAMPATPALSSVESRFIDPFQDMQTLWTTINADATLTGVPLPLILTGDYLAATFTTDLTNLRAAFVTAKNASEAAQLARRNRDVLLRPAELRLKQYREVIQGRFAGTAFEQSLPALSPPPGATPDPVEATGEWVGAQNQAVFQWAASPNPNLAHYSLRYCVGTQYRVSNETVAADIPKTQTTFATVTGLPVADTKAIYRVYVVLTTDNERGSNDVPITRS